MKKTMERGETKSTNLLEDLKSGSGGFPRMRLEAVGTTASFLRFEAEVDEDESGRVTWEEQDGSGSALGSVDADEVDEAFSKRDAGASARTRAAITAFSSTSSSSLKIEAATSIGSRAQLWRQS